MGECLLFSKSGIYQSFTTCFIFFFKLCLRHAFVLYTLVHLIPSKHSIIFYFIFASFCHFSINPILANCSFHVLSHNKSVVILICICLLLKGVSLNCKFTNLRYSNIIQNSEHKMLHDIEISMSSQRLNYAPYS